ncbi:YceI family protein [uncultured Aquimarina sp.]|uniref:YceI family protein n=1 Tax=uncultured Aquimarina sp. TaxID=575652 RepID=UPI002612BCAD|nr:YceI family protein [uncultured Aquimarina sp.]
MKTLQILLITLCLHIGLQKAYTQNFELDTRKSELFWTGKAAFTSYSLKGTIATKKGIISISDTTITALNIFIDMKSLDHENNDLKNHLKNEDFFEVKAFPKATFLINNVIEISNKKAILHGALTIKGKTNTENIAVRIEQAESGITLKFNHTIDRTKYGVNHNSPSIFKRMKENAIADEFTLEGTLIFLKEKKK